MKKKLLSILMILMIVPTFIPTVAFADETYTIRVGNEVKLEHGVVKVLIANEDSKMIEVTPENVPPGGTSITVDAAEKMIYVMLIPDEGYELKYSNVLDESKNPLNTNWNDGFEGEIWFENVPGNLITISPAFAKRHNVTISGRVENGTVTADKATAFRYEDITLTATPTHTVTFDVNGGSNVPSQTVESNTKVTEPDRPVKDGWYFGGWCTDKDCTQKYDFDTPVTGDLTLYASWYVAVSYDSFDTPDGTPSKDNKVKYNSREPYSAGIVYVYEGKEMSLEAKPAEGYRFVGWVKSEIDAKDPSSCFSTANPLKFTCSLDAFKEFGVKRYADLGINTYRAVALFEKIPTHTVTYKVANGTWSDGTTADKTEIVSEGAKPAEVPTGMIAGIGYTGGAWDTDPSKATISGNTTFTYTFVAKPDPSQTDDEAQIDKESQDDKPQTGDSSPVKLWVAVMILSITGFFGTVLISKRHR